MWGSGWLNFQAMQPIEESFQRLRQFTADASHELRSPLMAISTNAEVALTYPEGIAKERWREISGDRYGDRANVSAYRRFITLNQNR